MLGLCAVAGVIVSYYWRVFYGLDARGVPPLQITGLCVVLAMAAGAAALLLRHCKDFAKRGACCILLCGALFAFANPPLQTPDETDHYLRTYAISMGRFDFDAKRSYPEDVNELMDAFPGAWVNAHTSAGLGIDPDTNAEQPYNTAGYALKQYGKDGRVESIWDSFTQYINWEKRDSAADSVTEPISFLILPFLPGALGMALARLFGFGALGCLYGGRLMNLLVYTLLCYAALRSAIAGAIDRGTITTGYLAGHAKAARFPLSPSASLYPAEMAEALASPSLAATLENAGVTDSRPRTLTILVSESDSFKVSIADYLSRTLSGGALTIKVRALPWNDYLTALQNGNFDLYLGEVRLTADWDISPLVRTGGALNYGGYADEQCDTLLDTFLQSESEETARTLYRYLDQSAPIAPIAFRTSSVLTPSGLIDGLTPTASSPFYGLANWVVHFDKG